MNVTTATLCVFVRAPNLGQVKSRLAASIGESAALAAYINLVEHLLDQLNTASTATPIELQAQPKTQPKTQLKVQLWLADDAHTPAAEQQVHRWQQQTRQPLYHQQGANLGLRMDHALASSVAHSRYALLVGSDCPTINLDYLAKAIAALEQGADVVLGPAEDGGYGLVGVTQAQPTLFEGIAWGTERVLAQTLAQADQRALRVELLESLWDVDYLADWERFCRTYPSSTGSAES